jgi:hypothetical protein
VLLFAMLAALPTAHAQAAAELVAGEPDFTDCLGSESCEANFYAFLSESMAEQGFAMQWDPVSTSAAVRPGGGLVVGGRLDTFPFGAPPSNLSGKEENTQFSPVLPRLEVGWLGGDEDAFAWGVGASFLPPVPVGGASALVAGAMGSASWAVGGHTRIGAEAVFSYTRARAPIVATQDQLASRDEFSNPDNLDPDQFSAVCGGGDCIDTFRVADSTASVVASWQLGDWSPYAKLGVTWVEERLDVEYDATGWRVAGLAVRL